MILFGEDTINDSLTGTVDDDELYGLGGSDQLSGLFGDDLLDGGAGDDVLSGGVGNDLMLGGAGDDYLDGGEGDDTMKGGAGRDEFNHGTGGSDVLLGGGGRDLFHVDETSGASIAASGGAGRDEYRLHGSSEESSRAWVVRDFAAGAGGDLIDISGLLTDIANYGYTGGNPFSASLGFLRFVQSGNDTLLQCDADGSAGRFRPPGSADDSFSWVTELTLRGVDRSDLSESNLVVSLPPLVIGGTDNAERIEGDFFSERINGLGGSDEILGGGGNDTLVGGAGNDSLAGGRGDDTLVWDSGDTFDGGAGVDVLRVAGAALNLTRLANDRITDVERIILPGGRDSVLTLARADVLDLSSTSNVLTVLGNAGDTVNLKGEFTLVSTSGGLETWRNGAATVRIEVEIDVV